MEILPELMEYKVQKISLQPVVEKAIYRCIGLRNVNERIRLVYGEGYGIEIASRKDEYTRVTMRLPNTQQV